MKNNFLHCINSESKIKTIQIFILIYKIKSIKSKLYIKVVEVPQAPACPPTPVLSSTSVDEASYMNS